MLQKFNDPKMALWVAHYFFYAAIPKKIVYNECNEEIGSS